MEGYAYTLITLKTPIMAKSTVASTAREQGGRVNTDRKKKQLFTSSLVKKTGKTDTLCRKSSKLLTTNKITVKKLV